MPQHRCSEAAGPSESEPVVPDAAVKVGHENTATFEQTGNPLLLIGRNSGVAKAILQKPSI